MFPPRPVLHPGTGCLQLALTRERERDLAAGVEKSNGAKIGLGAVRPADTPSFAPPAGAWRIRNAALDGAAHAALVDELKRRFS